MLEEQLAVRDALIPCGSFASGATLVTWYGSTWPAASFTAIFCRKAPGRAFATSAHGTEMVSAGRAIARSWVTVMTSCSAARPENAAAKTTSKQRYDFIWRGDDGMEAGLSAPRD